MSAKDIAKESYLFWRSVGYTHEKAIAWLSMEAGETSFRDGVVGDHGHAWGPFQHQGYRIRMIALPPPKGCGIDIRDEWENKRPGAHLRCLEATDWETTKGLYKHIRPLLLAADTPEKMVTLLVVRFEQSLNPGNQDIDRRLALYNYWDRVAEGWEWP